MTKYVPWKSRIFRRWLHGECIGAETLSDRVLENDLVSYNRKHAIVFSRSEVREVQFPLQHGQRSPVFKQVLFKGRGGGKKIKEL